MKNRLKTSPWMVLAALALLGTGAAAQAAPDVTCTGFMYKPEKEEIAKIRLKQSAYDPEWYEGEIENYGLGADYSYLPDGGIGLIIYNHESDRSTSVTTGFRQIGKSRHYEAELKFYDLTPAGERIAVGVRCGYTALSPDRPM